MTAQSKWIRFDEGNDLGYENGNARLYDNASGAPGFGAAEGSGRWALEIDGRWIANYDSLAQGKEEVETLRAEQARADWHESNRVNANVFHAKEQS